MKERTFRRGAVWAVDVATFFAYALAPAFAQTGATVAPTGRLSVPRQFHNATTLTDGRVLITGGFAVVTDWPVWSSAELYDPAAGKFTLTGSMRTPRMNHSATLLPDGKVLIAGGMTRVNIGVGPVPVSLATAELYDPATGVFQATGRMTTARALHTATVLTSGKVLITGGASAQNGVCCAPHTAELYDPVTGTFTPTGSMSTQMVSTQVKAVLLASGKVLTVGGPSGGEPVAGGELYDPGSGQFTPTASRVYEDSYPTSATLLSNGQVLVTVLGADEDAGDRAELFDPATGSFAAVPNMSSRRMYTTGTSLSNGAALITGRVDGWPEARAEIYATETGEFGQVTDTTSAEGHTASPLQDGTVLLTAGWVCCGRTLDTAEIYQPRDVRPAPRIALVPDEGNRHAAVLHGGTATLVSPDQPATQGEVLEMYGTGLIDRAVVPPRVSIGGRAAEVLFFGKAPAHPDLNQINVRVPAGLPPGSAPLVFEYLGRFSNQVAIAMR